LIAMFIGFSGLGMQAVHELGHVAAAWATGGEVVRPILHPLAISRTDLADNPHPLIVVWAAPVIGALLPLLAWLIARLLRCPGLYLLRFSGGFCLVANGAYIAFGPGEGGADTGVLLAHGTPRWAMVAFGLPAAALGLLLWNGVGPHFGFGQAKGEVSRRATIVSAALFFAAVAAELALSGS
jgi:hypothetical protein